MNDNEPTTEAGRALLAEFGGQEFDDDTPEDARQSWLDLQSQVASKIIAIEREAREQAEAEFWGPDDNPSTRAAAIREIREDLDALIAAARPFEAMYESGYYDVTRKAEFKALAGAMTDARALSKSEEQERG